MARFVDVFEGLDAPAVEILDIGALSEGTDRYQPLVDRGQARVTGFEPNPTEYARLRERAGPYTYFPKFLGDGQPKTLHVARYPGCSSLLAPDPTVINMFTGIGAEPPGGNFAILKTEPVETTRLDDIDGLRAPDFLKIDVQGAELMVLENGRRTLESVLVLESEVEFLALYKDQPLFADIDAFLRSQGFLLHKLIEVAGRNFRPVVTPNPLEPISQILWADAVYVRDFRTLGRWTETQLVKAATVLHEVYLSYDLVNLLLLELDRRRPQARPASARYLDFLRAQPNLPNLYLTQRLTA
jgi:FkbM family methyltransferase